MLQFAIITLLQLIPSSHFIKEDTVRFTFIGDIMQHTNQLESAYIGGNKKDDLSYCYKEYFKYLTPIFKNSDIIGANIETTFAPGIFTGYPSFSSPFTLLRDAADAGINLFLAANNHSADKGANGIQGSINYYNKLNLKYVGIYKDSVDKAKNHPLIINKNNISISILNYTYGTNGINVPKPYIVNLINKEDILKDIKKSRLKGADVIIATLHWGVEYNTKESKEQKELESFLKENGVNIIIGSHPHVPQPVAIYKLAPTKIKGITAYSLGNAISNMTAQNTRIGLMISFSVIKSKPKDIRISDPEIRYIWTARPTDTKKGFTIIDIENYLNGIYESNNISGKDLIKHYYNKFKNSTIK